MRMRSELQNLNSTNADKQIYDRMVDVRLRPDISYTINDYMCVKAVFEIGELQYGSAGGALGTDGKNLETKNVYIDIKPTQNHLFRLGLMAIKDAHSVIVDTDLAGLLWKGKFENYDVNMGWFAVLDNDEIYNDADEHTYSLGTTLIMLDQSYRLNKYLKMGINNIFVMDRTEYIDGVNRDAVSIFFAPRAEISLGKFFLDGQFIANNKYADYKNVGEVPGFVQPHDPDALGLAMSVKSRFEMDSRTTFRANFLFRGCQENRWENYEAFKSFYDTGLEILNENPNGIYYHNPMQGFKVDVRGIYYELGLVVPSVFVDWKYRDNVTFTGGFGFIMNDSFDYGKRIDFSDPNSVVNDDVFIAWEMDFKADIVLYNKLQLLPYFAFMVPSENFAYNKVGSLENFDDDLEPATDLQFKIGMTTKYSF
ncbi:MAG: hypothetical protein JXN63_02600, partial [Candidatus Delongbacteria bacterium]|nr:hypothetical protein [Candidatus Delongbacteria bacterium]